MGKNRLFSRLLLCLWLGIAGLARAGNRHEHLHALFSDSAIERAYEAWARAQPSGTVPLKFGDIPITRLMNDPAASISQIYGPETLLPVVQQLGGLPADFNLNNPAHRRAFAEKTKGMTLAQFTKAVETANQALFKERELAWLRSMPPGDQHIELPPPPGAVLARGDPHQRFLNRSLFSFSHVSQSNPSAYQAMEGIRRTFMEGIIERHGIDGFVEFWRKGLEYHWEEGMGEVRNIVDLSVPRAFFRREVYEASGRTVDARFSFLLSLPRKQLLTLSDEEFERELADVVKAMKEGWAHGIDITGSIQETSEKEIDLAENALRIREMEARIKELTIEADRADGKARKDGTYTKETSRALRDQVRDLKQQAERLKVDGQKSQATIDKLKARLQRLLTVMGENGGEVRLHAYEAGRSGPFYQAMRGALDEMAEKRIRLPRIRIGHIAAMKEPDIRWLEGLCGKLPVDQRPVVEANPYSNHVLHGTPWKEMVATLTDLHRRRIRVLIGADEEGVLGGNALLPNVIDQLRAAGADEEMLTDLASHTLERSRSSVPAPSAERLMFNLPAHFCPWIKINKHHIYMTDPNHFRARMPQQLPPPR